MHEKPFAFSLLCVALAGSGQTAQTSTPDSTGQRDDVRNSVCRPADPGSIAIATAAGRGGSAKKLLQDISVATGWANLPNSAVVTVVGTLELPSGKHHSFTAVFSGVDDRSLSIETDSGTHEVKILHGVARTGKASDSSMAIGWTADDAFQFMPFEGILRVTDDTLASLPTISTGTARVKLDIYKIHHYPDPALKAFQVNRTRVLIDPTTKQVSEIESCDLAPHRPGTGQVVNRQYSNYVTQSGLSYPSTITENRSGQLIHTVTIVSLNVQAATSQVAQ